MKTSILLASSLIAVMGFTTSAHAAFDITIDADSLQPFSDFTVNCESGCEGLNGPTVATWSVTDAEGYDTDLLANNSPGAQLDFLNDLLGLSGSNAIQGADRTDGSGRGFTTNREYFAIKKGQWIAYFLNTSGGSIEVDFLDADGDPLPNNDAGYSHYTEFGAVVPVPAAAWLFASALGVFGYLAKRRANA